MRVRRTMILPLVLTAVWGCFGAGATEPEFRRNPNNSPSSPPSASTGEIFRGISSQTLVYDDFRNYSSKNDLLALVSQATGGKATTSTAKYAASHINLLDVDKSVTYNGHPTIKYTQVAGSATSPSLSMPVPAAGANLKRIWFRATVRFSPGWSTSATSGTGGFSLASWNWNGGLYGRGALDFTNVSQYSASWYVQQGSTQVGPFTSTTGPRASTEWNDGKWYNYVVLVEQLSSTATRQTWWMAVDGQTPVLKGSVVGTVKSGTAPLVAEFKLGSSFNGPLRKGQSFWIGQWEMINGVTHSNPYSLTLPGGSVPESPNNGGSPDDGNSGPQAPQEPEPQPEPEPEPKPEPKPDTVVTTPPPTNPSTGRSLGVTSSAFLYDDFSKYGTTAGLRTAIADFVGGTTSWKLKPLYGDGVNGQLAEIDNSVKYNGHATLKYNQPGGTSSTPQLWVGFPDGKTVTKLWIRVKVRFSKGFTTDGVTPNYGKGYKLLGWTWKGFNGRGSLELGSVDQYYLACYVYDTINSTTPDVIAGRVATEWADEQWYESIILVEVGTNTIRQRWWWGRDGQTLTKRADQTLNMKSGKAAPPVGGFMLGMNFNQTRAATQNQALWYGQWELVDGSQTANPFNLSGL